MFGYWSNSLIVPVDPAKMELVMEPERATVQTSGKSEGKAGLFAIITFVCLHQCWLWLGFGAAGSVYLRVCFMLLFFALHKHKAPETRASDFFGIGKFDKNSARVLAVFLPLFIGSRVLLDCFGLPGDHLRVAPAAFNPGGFFSDCLVAPVNEELLFRGLFLSILLRRMNSRSFAVLISACLFANCHEVGGQSFLVVFIFGGLLLGLIYEKTGSLAVTLILHAFWNAVSLLPLPR